MVETVNKALGDYNLRELASCFTGMKAKRAIRKLQKANLEVKQNNASLRNIASDNGVGINQLIEVVARGEQKHPNKRIGKPIEERTVNEAIEEIGINKEEALSIFSRKGIMHTGNFELPLQILSYDNKLLACDIYTLLGGKKFTDATNQNDQSPIDPTFMAQFGKRNVKQLAELIKQQQPEAEVSKTIILNRLKRNRVVVTNEQLTMAEIAENNKIKLDELMKIITLGKRTRKPPMKGAQKLDGPPAHVDLEKNARRRIAETSIAKLAIQYQLDEEMLIDALKHEGFDATNQSTIKEIAEKYGEKIKDIYLILKKEKDKQLKDKK